MNYRKAYDLTQSDLAERYGVSGPAIFKFEKGFVTPSLKLWQKIAANIDIPEKEAVLIWVREKLPSRMRNLIYEMTILDQEALEKELDEIGKQPNALQNMRETLLGNPNLSPALKKFMSDNEMWETLKPSKKELLFLIKLSQQAPPNTVSQFRDAMMVARSIQNPGD